MMRCRSYSHFFWRAFACMLSLAVVGCGHTRQSKKPEHETAALLNPGGTSKVTNQQAADLRIALGRTHEEEGRLDEAETAYRDAIKNDSKRADAHARLAILCDKRGDFKESSKEFAEAIKRAPKDPELLCDQGYSFYVQRRWSEAETSLRKAIKLSPRHARSHNNLALVLAREGNADAAVAEFVKAGCDPSDARANLGLVLAMEGRSTESQAAYTRALELKPASKVAREGLTAANNVIARQSTAKPAQSAQIASTGLIKDEAVARTSFTPAR